MLPLITAACGGESNDDLFSGGRPKADAGNTGASGGFGGGGGASGAGGRGGAAGGGSGGTGAQTSGGSAGTSDASAGTSGGGAGGVGGRGGAGASAGTGGRGGTIGTGGSAGTRGSAGSGGVADGGGSAGRGGTAGVGNPDSSFGAGGTSGTSGTAGAGGTQGADAGSDGGSRPCSTSSNCRNDEFCSKTACVMLTGECKPRPKTCPTNEAPVCGCEGVNYWNDCLRQQAGIAAGTTGECEISASCGGLPGYTCPGGRAHCAHLHKAQSECGISDAFGACWVIPEQCPQIVIGTTHRPCSGTDRCLTKCEAIKTEHDYFTDSTCPQ